MDRLLHLLCAHVAAQSNIPSSCREADDACDVLTPPLASSNAVCVDPRSMMALLVKPLLSQRCSHWHHFYVYLPSPDSDQ